MNMCKRGLVMTTDYSGIGTAEIVARCCQTAMKSQQLCDQDFVKCQRACDIEPHCRRALELLGEDTCIFGDMLERIPAPVLKKVKGAMDRANKRMEKLMDKGSAARHEVVAQVGKAFLGKAIGGSIAAAVSGGTKGPLHGRGSSSSINSRGSM